MSIEKGLLALDSVEATVNFATESARITFDPSIVDISRLVSTVESLGYGARTLAETTPDMLDAEVRERVASLKARLTMMTGMSGGIHVYFEVAVAVTIFLLAGRYFEARAKRRAGDALRALLALGARTATVLRDGEEVVIDAALIKVGERFVVRPGLCWRYSPFWRGTSWVMMLIALPIHLLLQLQC